MCVCVCTHTYSQALEAGFENYFLSVLTDPSTGQPLGLQQDPTSSSLGCNNGN